MRILNFSFLFLLCILMFVGCTTTEKIFEKGDYASVINRLNYKATKGILEDADTALLEKSIQRKLDRERLWLEQKLASKEGEDWVAGYQHLDDLVELQVKYASYIQLDKRNINWIDIRKWDLAFGNVLGTYHKDNFDKLYEKYSESKNKNYLIDAYFELDKVEHFHQNLLNIDSLRSVFTKEGLRNMNIDFLDESSDLYQLRHLRYFIDPANSKWSNFGTFEDPDFTINVVLEILDKDEQRIQNLVEYSNDIIVDYEIQTDNNGDEVQLPITQAITALVNEVQIEYSVDAEVRVDIYLHSSKQLVSSESFRRKSIALEIENYILDGNIQAVPPNLRLSSGNPNSTSTFDYDYNSLTEDVLEQISEVVEDYLEQW